MVQTLGWARIKHTFSIRRCIVCFNISTVWNDRLQWILSVNKTHKDDHRAVATKVSLLIKVEDSKMWCVELLLLKWLWAQHFPSWRYLYVTSSYQIPVICPSWSVTIYLSDHFELIISSQLHLNQIQSHFLHTA